MHRLIQVFAARRLWSDGTHPNRRTEKKAAPPRLLRFCGFPLDRLREVTNSTELCIHRKEVLTTIISSVVDEIRGTQKDF